MSSISSTSILQQILAQNSSTSSSSSSSSSSLSDILAQANGTDLGDGNTSSGSSYLLDLSPEAQAYLTSQSSTGTTTSTGSTTSSTGASVILSPVQQDKLNAILQKYKDAPYTDATFKAIQKDMSAAGIGADTLAGQAEMRNLNPTAMLLNALNGGDGSVGTIGGSADIATLETNFMGSVNQQWQQISSDYDSTTGGSKSTEAAAANDTTAGGTSSAS